MRGVIGGLATAPSQSRLVRSRVVETGVVRTGVVETCVVGTGVVRTGVVRTGVVETGVVETGVVGTGVVTTRVAGSRAGGGWRALRLAMLMLTGAACAFGQYSYDFAPGSGTNYTTNGGFSLVTWPVYVYQANTAGSYILNFQRFGQRQRLRGQHAAFDPVGRRHVHSLPARVFERRGVVRFLHGKLYFGGNCRALDVHRRHGARDAVAESVHERNIFPSGRSVLRRGGWIYLAQRRLWHESAGLSE